MAKSAADTYVIGLFTFENDLAISGEGSYILNSINTVNGSLITPSGYYVTLNDSLYLGPNAVLKSTNSSASSILIGNDKTIYLEGDNVQLGTPCQLRRGNFTIDGLGHTFALNNETYIANQVVAGHPNLTMTNINLVCNTTTAFYSFTAANTSIGTLTFKNSTIHPVGTTGKLVDATSVAAAGGISILGNVRVEGPGTRLAIGGNIVIGPNSKLYIGPGVTVTEISVISLTDSTSVLHLDGCTFYTGFKANATFWVSKTIGMTLTKGTVLFENKVKIINSAYGEPVNTDMTNGFIFGDGTEGNDVQVHILGAAYVSVDGCMKYNHS